MPVPNSKQPKQTAKIIPQPPTVKPAHVVEKGVSEIHEVRATSFADPADILGFQKAKAKGMTDIQAFAFGDNGVGKWGRSTKEGSGPCCALPPEDWEHLAKPDGTKVRVTVKGKSIVCDLRDTMPKKKNIKNGAGIDLNPDAVKALGQRIPLDVAATWQYV